MSPADVRRKGRTAPSGRRVVSSACRTWVAVVLCALMLAWAAGPALGAEYSVLHQFGGGAFDGAQPYGSLSVGGDGLLYGMTSAGGAYDRGTVFSYDPLSDSVNVLHSFASGEPDGSLEGSILSAGNGTLYGVTPFGGANDHGMIFEINNNGSFNQLYSFSGGDDQGSHPHYASLTRVGTTLYGTTAYGGENGAGALFSYDTAGSAFNVLHEFGGSGDGCYPYGTPQWDGTALHGMTCGGGANGQGTIYRLDPGTAAYGVLYDLDSSSGTYPYGSLLLQDSVLYGMAAAGGASGKGTVFKYDPVKDSLEVLHDFTGTQTDGASPRGAVIYDGKLWGMTQAGGLYDDAGVLQDAGTMFSLATDGSGFDLIHSFGGTYDGYPDGADPWGSLVRDGATMYGMTQYGGESNLGVLFRYGPEQGPGPEPVPEPATLVFFATGLAGAISIARRTKPGRAG